MEKRAWREGCNHQGMIRAVPTRVRRETLDYGTNPDLRSGAESSTPVPFLLLRRIEVPTPKPLQLPVIVDKQKFAAMMTRPPTPYIPLEPIEPVRVPRMSALVRAERRRQGVRAKRSGPRRIPILWALLAVMIGIALGFALASHRVHLTLPRTIEARLALDAVHAMRGSIAEFFGPR
jgi:hypothetical protein